MSVRKVTRNKKGQLSTEGYGVVLAKTPLAVRMPVETDKIVRNIPNYNQFCRIAIHHALIKKGLIPQEVGELLQEAEMLDPTL